MNVMRRTNEERALPRQLALAAAVVIALTGPAIIGAVPTGIDDIALYNRQGAAVAYIAADEALTIYLWEGKPVAYLETGANGDLSIYGFNGKHLGWIVSGIVRDHEGDAVGFEEGATRMLTQLEPLKGLKQLSPLRELRELEPLEPLWSNSWSTTPLSVFLALGTS